jgi:hypothetical protein
LQRKKMYFLLFGRHWLLANRKKKVGRNEWSLSWQFFCFGCA